MMKKYFLLGIFSMILVVSLFAEAQVERITYQETRPDGTLRDVTVNAVPVAWRQINFYIDGNYLVKRVSYCPFDGEWSDWEVVERSPSPARYGESIRSLYDLNARMYSQYPRMGTRDYSTDGFDTLALFAIPDGRIYPYWWSEDGRSYNIFQKFYLVMP
jgi:hypothetical protein